MTALRASVRLQLHAGFDFDAAAAQVDYFAQLGISHLYLSPVTSAVPGSLHGYDNIDPSTLSAALGGEAGFTRLAERVRAHHMGILLDIVPNHMAAHPANRWWADVLRHGQRSAHADWFDIDWDAPGCDGKLWLPVLDRPLADALDEGVLTLAVGADGPFLRHHDLQLPLSSLSFPAPPQSWASWAERCLRSPVRLQDLLHRQAYRLAWWRSGADRINYRRFFDIDGLVALRAERDDVFDAVHALPLRLVEQGRVDGLRIDHIDGLAEPAAYLRRLRLALDAAGATRGLPPGTVTLHVEKILADGESLPAQWDCHGTTGYDFMDQVGALLHAGDSEPALQSLWQSVSTDARSFDTVQQQARVQMLRGSLQCDLDRLLRDLQRIAAIDPASADLTPRMFERAVIALLQHFPVYRTHGLRSAADQAWLQQASVAAHAQLDGGDRVALERVCGYLRAALDPPCTLLARFELLAAPLSAKAGEDTALYRYSRLISRNEVGSDPQRISLPPSGFIALAQQRGQHWPQALLALATHDHKRGPDARCRVAVLSWNVEAWALQQRRWNMLAASAGQPCPLPGAEATMLWQALLASWPLQAEALDAGFIDRVAGWLQKALREGKRVSSWSEPDVVLEHAAAAWLRWLGSDPSAGELRAAIDAFVHQLAPLAMRLGLVQVALQACCPGVLDLYQGNEGWDTSMVDPDNRRPVDYRQRRDWLTAPGSWHDALQDAVSGAPKALLLAKMLQYRAQHPELFEAAPLTVLSAGDADDRMVLARVHVRAALVLVVDRNARFAGGTTQVPGRNPARAAVAVAIPDGTWRNLLDDRRLQGGHEIATEVLLDGSAVAVWVTGKGDDDGR